MTVKRSVEFAFQSFLFAVDFLAVYLGYVLSFLVYEYWVGTPPQPFSEVKFLALVPAVLCVTAFVLTSVYRCQPGPMELDRLRRLLSAFFWSQVMTFALSFFTKSYGYSRLMVIGGFLLSIVGILLGRALTHRLLGPIRDTLALKRTLILGAGRVGKTLARNLVNSPGHAEIIGFLDDQFPQVTDCVVRVGERDHVFPILGKLSDLADVCQRHRVNEVIVAMTRAAQTLHQDLLERSKELSIHFSIVPSALELMLTGAEAYSIGHIPLFRIGERPAFILSPALKRILDIVGASAIAILCSPIWLAALILIKLDSPGPVLFLHERVGKKGKKFKLFKFRSMRVDVDPYAVTPKNQEDPRITKFGKFLRRTSVDELPQIINVLKGDMSLVGPRPEMPFIVSSYDELQKIRLSVKPGLTGVWQISADRANPIHENLDYDFYYLKNQSVWLDLAILLKTFTSVAKGVGAY